MENNTMHIRQNWFQRNWKWFVPTGCLSLIVIAVLFGLAVFKGVTSIMKESDVYKHSMEVARKDKNVIEKIGNNIDSDGMMSGNISTTNYSGEAFMDIPIKGSKGEGLLHVEAEKQNNIWTYQTLDFYPKGSTDAIDLLNKNP